MSDNVVDLGNVTKLDLPPNRILSKALDGNLQSVVLMGYDEDGEFYFASSQADGGDVLWLLELAKHQLMAIHEEMSE